MKNNESVMENIFKKVSYSTGFICAKAAKLKNIADSQRWKRFFSGMNGLFTTAANLLQDAGKKTANVKEPSPKGFEPVKKQVDKEEQLQGEDKLGGSRPKLKAKKPASPKKEKRSKPEIKFRLKTSKRKAKASAERKKIKEPPPESLNPDFEKEIEEITRSVAEV